MRVVHKNRRFHLHGIRVVVIGVALLSLAIARVDTANFSVTERASAEVLAYATNINRGDLLAETNAARAQNGLAPLILNSQLNSSSQNKAQHMIDNNYWAHIAPDGTQPWYFFEQAGYAYTRAGENLAYGFDTSSGTVTAWMNSASHRANILGDYQDIGFGIANGSSYQSGQNTVVVAHYGKPAGAPAPSPAPAAAPSSPAPTTPVAPATVSPSTPSAPSESPTSSPTNPAVPAQETPDIIETKTNDIAASPVAQVQTSETKRVNLLQSVLAGSAPSYGVISLGLLIASLGGFVLTHRTLFQHAVATSEAYVIRHPMVDFAALGAIALLVLTSTVSRI